MSTASIGTAPPVVDTRRPQPASIRRPRFVPVTFSVPASLGCEYVDVVGSFMAWCPLRMDPHDDGSFSVSIELESNGAWHYRFLLDGDRLMNDWSADEYAELDDGSWISVLRT